MKTRFIVPLTLFVLCMNMLVTSCKKEDDVNWQATYTGLVIDQVTELPYSNCEIRVTDGSNIVVKTQADENGEFSVTVNMSEVNDSFHFLFGNASIGQKRVAFPSFAAGSYSLGTIYVHGPSKPDVETLEIVTITSISATIKSNITSNGGFAVIARGVCWSTNANPTISDNHTTDGNGTGEYSSTIYGLQASSRYYVRAYATNEKGTNYGAVLSFVTSNGTPIVETSPISEDVTESSLLTGGNVIDDCGFAIIERGVVYSTLPYPTLDNANKVKSGSGVGYFSVKITDITPSTHTYYIRAYAINEKGTSYGDQVIMTPEQYEYLSLPVVLYGGYKYHIYKDMGTADWTTAMQLCESLTFGGYDDWFLPNQNELQSIANANVGGWTCSQGYYISFSHVAYYYDYYWTSSEYTSTKAYCIQFKDDIQTTSASGAYATLTQMSIYENNRVRAVRKDKIQ